MSDPRTVVHFITHRADAGKRLDLLVLSRAGDLFGSSRRRVQLWIQDGHVRMNGRTVRRPASPAMPDSVVEIDRPVEAAARQRPSAEAFDLSIVYEDHRLLALNKAAGTVVHPSYRNRSGTLLNGVLWHLRDRPAARPGILTRLDRGTSGLVLVALGGDVQRQLQGDGAIAKEYLVLVRGRPPREAGVLSAPLGRDADDRRRVVVRDDGAPSRTRYEVLGTGDDVSLLRCELLTGRTHQIRVHMAAAGWPVVGDAAYGVPHPLLEHQALHAWRVTVTHPAWSAPLRLEARLPDDFRRALEQSCPGARHLPLRT
ncbi:MAG: RluA family pseudouridine synthase [Vicinamibacterales bacterium]